MIRSLWILHAAVVVTAVSWGCAVPGDDGAASTHRALAAGDAVATDAPPTDAPPTDATLTDAPPELSSAEQGAADLFPGVDQSFCGAVTAVGCCDGETLWWCAKGVLKSESCVGKPSCGWNSSGFYDCNTSGVADPAGAHPWACDTGDAGVPPSDLGGDGMAKPCGDVPLEGCCAGGVLRYCEDGALKTLSCAFNPTCGWFAQGGYYDCGTTGGADPSGVHPRLCPGAAPADSGPDLGGDTAQGSDLGGDTAAPGDGCGSCELGGGAAEAGLGAGAWAAALAALLLALRRRASA